MATLTASQRTRTCTEYPSEAANRGFDLFEQVSERCLQLGVAEAGGYTGTIESAAIVRHVTSVRDKISLHVRMTYPSAPHIDSPQRWSHLVINDMMHNQHD